ncbi:MAG: hypothetical protein II826_09210 [Prevotella sp.]|nr:hypothetical protein [Prevotella sp.]
MKKLFTMLALLACFMGAKAVEIVDAEVDFSKYTDISEWNFPYGWGGSESAKARLSIQDGCLHFHSEEATDPTWDCQFFPIGGVNAEPDIVYTLHFKIKGTVAQNVSLLGFGTTPYGQFPITTDWVEGTVDYTASSSDGNLLMQCGDYVGDWDIAYLKITHDGKEQRPVEWLEQLTNGDAEAAWPAWSLEINDDGINPNWRGDRAPEICAWALTMGRNYDDQASAITSDTPRARPFPADIEEEAGNPSNHVFAVHVTQVEPIDDEASIAWSNQFWIEAPKACKAGTQVKLHFRYKAEKAATVGTQIHQKNPSIYLHYVGIGDVNFTSEWQEFDKTITFSDAQGGGYSVAFNLTSGLQEPNVFYFDDLSWQLMKLDEGYFVAAANTATGAVEYDLDNAAELTWDEDLQAYTATVGTAGKSDTWVNEVMISTVRGNDGAFKGATLKPSGAITGNDPDEWLNYTEGSNAKIKLPAAGVWTIAVDTVNKQMNFLQVEGEQLKEPLKEIPNPAEVVVHGQERDFTSAEQPADEEAGIEAGTGQPWDNQFFIVANRELKTGEVTIVKFKYRSSIDAKTSTQLHGMPGAYKHYAAIGDVNFVGSDEWQNFEYKLTVPSEADGMQSIAFNMAEIKEACDYYIKDVVWMLEDMTETLINTEGVENFYVKEGAGTDPHIFGQNPNQGVDGDVEGDGVVDVADISAILSHMSGAATYERADVNGDGVVDVADISTVLTVMAGGKIDDAQ